MTLFIIQGIAFLIYVPQRSLSSTLTNYNTSVRKTSLLPSLTELLKQSGSDKYIRHHYEHYYEKWLEPYRHMDNVSLLEIGADRGSSMAFWNSYFTHPYQIVGLAYGPDSAGVEDKAHNLSHVNIVRGDQSSAEVMAVLKKMGPFDVIVDDGSHVPAHVIFSLFHLWPSVRPGGMYVIEDLETSYWQDGDVVYDHVLRGTGIGQSANTNAVEKVKQFIDVMVKNQIGVDASVLTILPGDDQLCSVEFGRNIVSLKKCSPLEMELQPVVQEIKHDSNMLKEWIAMARSSNPEGFRDP